MTVFYLTRWTIALHCIASHEHDRGLLVLALLESRVPLTDPGTESPLVRLFV